MNEKIVSVSQRRRDGLSLNCLNKIVDTNGDGVVSAGDTIQMGRYPTNLMPATTDFADWGTKQHQVAKVVAETPTSLFLENPTGATHDWNSATDQYSEMNGLGSSTLFDNPGAVSTTI